jgi:PilZ domain
MSQFDAAWAELRYSVRGKGDLGLLVGVTGSHLLLDGVPLDLSPAELDFAELLNAARVGSIRFLPAVSRTEFRQLVKTFVDDSADGCLAARVDSQFGYHTKSRIHTSESLFVQEGVGFYEGGSTTALESEIASGDTSGKRSRLKRVEKNGRRDGKAAASSSQPAASRKSQRNRYARASAEASFAAASSEVDAAELADVQAFESILHFEVQSSAIDQRPGESTVTDRSSGYDAKQASKELQAALLKVGEQMAVEADATMQTKLSAAFTRFSQEAIATKDYESLEQSLDVLAKLEDSRPGWAQSLRPRIGVRNCVPQFVETALGSEDVPDGLLGVLARVPEEASVILAVRLARSARCLERERVVDLARSLGAPCSQHLKELLRNAGAEKAAMAIGLLSRLDPYAVNELLPRRLRDNGRDFHDVIVRQLSIAGARERGHILANSLELFDAMILPLALDEIGMSGDLETAPKLLKLANGGVVKNCSDFLRVKAIEALGRLRAPTAAFRLREFVESRKTLGWEFPEEIRTAAAQALSKFDLAWARQFLPKSGLDANILALAPLDPKPSHDYVRQRRYKRIRLARNVPATISTANSNYATAISVLSLDGGLLSGDIRLPVGSEATLKIPAGLRSISMQAVVRFVRAQKAGFEMVGMGLDDRVKLRRLLVSLGSAPSAMSLRA